MRPFEFSPNEDFLRIGEAVDDLHKRRAEAQRASADQALKEAHFPFIKDIQDEVYEQRQREIIEPREQIWNKTKSILGGTALLGCAIHRQRGSLQWSFTTPMYSEEKDVDLRIEVKADVPLRKETPGSESDPIRQAVNYIRAPRDKKRFPRNCWALA